jgi:dihydrofolate reductase
MSASKISIIAAIGLNREIGFGNKLLWHLPEDLKFFRNKTIGRHIIMGRLTHESIGGGKLLPGRKTVILSSDAAYAVQGAACAQNIDAAISACPSDDEIFVAGGQKVYEQFIGIADTMYITLVNAGFEADAFFPEISPYLWDLISEEKCNADSKHAYDYTFMTFKKRRQNE